MGTEIRRETHSDNCHRRAPHHLFIVYEYRECVAPADEELLFRFRAHIREKPARERKEEKSFKFQVQQLSKLLLGF